MKVYQHIPHIIRVRNSSSNYEFRGGFPQVIWRFRLSFAWHAGTADSCHSIYIYIFGHFAGKCRSILFQIFVCAGIDGNQMLFAFAVGNRSWKHQTCKLQDCSYLQHMDDMTLEGRNAETVCDPDSHRDLAWRANSACKASSGVVGLKMWDDMRWLIVDSSQIFLWMLSLLPLQDQIRIHKASFRSGPRWQNIQHIADSRVLPYQCHTLSYISLLHLATL